MEVSSVLLLGARRCSSVGDFLFFFVGVCFSSVSLYALVTGAPWLAVCSFHLPYFMYSAPISVPIMSK